MTDPQRSGGAVIDLLIHDIDFCLYLFGKPEFVSAVGFSDLDHGIDWTEARLEYQATGPVIITGGWHHPKSYPFTMEFTVISEGGTLEFRSGGEPLTLFDAAGSSEKAGPAEHDPFVEELKYFAQCVHGGQQPVLGAPEESAMAVKLARCMLESRERGGDRVACTF
jgi:predicted dehydrogenase